MQLRHTAQIIFYRMKSSNSTLPLALLLHICYREIYYIFPWCLTYFLGWGALYLFELAQKDKMDLPIPFFLSSPKWWIFSHLINSLAFDFLWLLFWLIKFDWQIRLWRILLARLKDQKKRDKRYILYQFIIKNLE